MIFETSSMLGFVAFGFPDCVISVTTLGTFIALSVDATCGVAIVCSDVGAVVVSLANAGA